jgi:AcrR family transcriptional regulator
VPITDNCGTTAFLVYLAVVPARDDIETQSSDSRLPTRADAVRNRQAVLAAAGKLLAERGLATQIEDIAAEAGVGVATIYRNFASREELVRAILVDFTEALIDAIETAIENTEPREALQRTVHTVIDLLAGQRVLVDAAVQFRRDLTEPDPAFLALQDVVGRVLAAAQRTGDANTDVTVDDLSELMIAAGLTLREPAARNRLAAVILRGVLTG